MRLYFFRHGEAAPKDDESIKLDRDRPLTPDGRQKTRAAADGLRRLQIPVDIVLTSPWLRARETAEIVAEVLGMNDRLEELEELAGDHSASDVLRGLARFKMHENVMLVGHQPLLGETVAWLLSLSTGMQVDLKKSGVCTIEVDSIPPKQPGTLLWMHTPKQLKLMR
jgi:phosphohistidine phosphatase